MKIVPNYKYFNDNLYGYICVSNVLVRIIDTVEFQRLRKIKQLATCHYVFHNATHSRHEHSIGVMHLANLITDCIAKSQTKDMNEYMSNIPELKNYYERKYENKKYPFDAYIAELIKIAALCHDIGHGPYSHTFDDVFNTRHEERSCEMIHKIIKNDTILSEMIHDDEIRFIQNLINPCYDIHKGFVYQIVSNTLNGLDVDKFDYIARDARLTINALGLFNVEQLVNHVSIIDNNINYPEQAVLNIISMYNTRYLLHKTVYNHKGVVSSHLMISEILRNMNELKMINIEKDFNIMTDEYITIILKLCNDDNELLRETKELLTRLEKHNLYKHIKTITSKEEIIIPDFVAQDKNIVVYNNKIGYVSGSGSNPLNDIYTYKTKNMASQKVDIKKYTNIVPDMYQEYICMIYTKNIDIKNTKITKWINKIAS